MEEEAMFADEDVLVCGYWIRSPAGDAADLVDALAVGIDCVRSASTQRPLRRLSPETRCGLVQDIDAFDNEFFEIKDEEARSIDPSQRLLLEGVLHAFNHAGLSLDTARTLRTAVVTSNWENEYPSLSTSRDRYSSIGNASSVMCGRISYFYGLTAASLAVDTACSSGLTAVHVAFEELRHQRADVAIVATSNLLLDSRSFESLAAHRFLSPSGRSATFDRDADGFVRSEGVAVVILARGASARRHGLRLIARIGATAVNNDGRSKSLTSPSLEAQIDLYRRLLHCASNSKPPKFVETHGTGTRVGDATELAALAQVFGTSTTARLSANKSTIGHTESASGLFSLVVSLQHAKKNYLTPLLHLRLANANSDRPLCFVGEECTLDAGIVGAFGVGGTNAAVFLDAREVAQTKTRQPWNVLLISAKTEEACRAKARSLAKFLKSSSADLGNAIYSNNKLASNFGVRMAVRGETRERLIRKLLRSRDVSKVSDRRPRIVVEFGNPKDLNYKEASKHFKEDEAKQRSGNPIVWFLDFLSGVGISPDEIRCGSLTILLETCASLKMMNWSLANCLWSKRKNKFEFREIISLHQSEIRQSSIQVNGSLNPFQAPSLQALPFSSKKSKFFVKISIEQKLICFSSRRSFRHQMEEVICEAFRQGHDISLAGDGQLIELPEYPFKKTRFWPDLQPRLAAQPIEVSNRKDFMNKLSVEQRLSSLHDSFRDENLPSNLDSLDSIELVDKLRKEFSLTMDYDVIEKLKTKARLIEYIQELLAVRQRGSSETRFEEQKLMKPEETTIGIIGLQFKLPQEVCSRGDILDALMVGQRLVRSADQQRKELVDLNSNQRGAFLDEDLSAFDNGFFGITLDEAKLMDPQHRLLLECAWAAFEEAGMPDLSKAPLLLAIASSSEYATLVSKADEDKDERFWMGTRHSVAASRLANLLGVGGAAMTVDTTCTSVATAIQNCIQTMQDGDQRYGVISTAQLSLSQNQFDSMSQMLSSEAESHPFETKASGFIRGEAVGVIILDKNPENAIAIIDSVTSNNSRRFLSPTSSSLKELLTSNNEMPYIEAHGVAISSSDKIEALAYSEMKNLRLGASKWQFGHAEAASGLVQIAKAVAILQGGRIFGTPSRFFIEELRTNTHITFPVINEEHPEVQSLGILSFGSNGTNAFTKLRKAEIRNQQSSPGHVLLPISAKTTELLNETCRMYAEFLRQTSSSLENIARSMQLNKTHYNLRMAILVKTHAEVVRKLQEPKPTSNRKRKPIVVLSRSAIKFFGEIKQIQAAFAGLVKETDAEFALTVSVARFILRLCQPLFRVKGRNALAVLVAAERLTLARANDYLKLPKKEQKEELEKLVREAPDHLICKKIQSKKFKLIKVSCYRDVLEVARRTYLAGGNVRWQLLSKSHTKVDLPPTVFQKVHTWYRPKRTLAEEDDEEPKQIVKQLSLNTTTADWKHLADHQLDGEAVLSGATLLTLLLQESSIACYKDITFMKKLSVVAGAATGLRLKNLDTRIELADEDDEAVVTVVKGEPKESVSFPPVTTGKKKIYSKAEMYERFAKAGYSYGPAFQVVQKLEVRGSSATAEIDSSTPFDAFLDGIFQAIVLVSLFNEMEDNSTFIPVHIEEFILNLTENARLQSGNVRLTSRKRAGAIFGDAEVTIDGGPMLQIRGLRCLSRTIVKNAKNVSNTIKCTTSIAKEAQFISVWFRETYGFETLDPTAGFFDLGLGSNQAMKLQEHIRRAHPKASPTCVFEYPNLRKLASYLHSLREDVVMLQEVIPVSNGGEIQDSRIGISSIACRLPGGVQDVREFWDLLVTGRDTNSRIPASRISTRDVLIEGTKYGYKVEGGHFLQEDIAEFDAARFRISRSEAERMDPQQRLLLECVDECLTEGCLLQPHSNLGVFVGFMGTEYPEAIGDAKDVQSMLGSAMSMVSGRVSYFFGSNGPSVTVDTACSSSLVALDMAVAAIKDGRCDQCIVAGVNLIVTERGLGQRANGGMLAPFCATFDARASGYSRADGCVVMLVEKASEERPLVVEITSMAVNHGGAAAALTAPNGTAQKELLTKAVGKATGQVSFWEAHGTGTGLGDPIEVNALSSLLKNVPLGAVKAQLGHGEAVAGLTGLAKTTLALKTKYLPANIHFHCVNKSIVFGSLRLPVIGEEMSSKGSAGVSSFGLSGTNAVAVISRTKNWSKRQRPPLPYLVLPLSARAETQLERVMGEMVEFVSSASTSIQDICSTAALCRPSFFYREALLVDSRNRSVTRIDLFEHQPKEIVLKFFTMNLPKVSKNFKECRTLKAKWIKVCELSFWKELLPELHIQSDNESSLCLSIPEEGEAVQIQIESFKDVMLVIGKLYIMKIKVNWDVLLGRFSRVSLPRHPVNREVYWFEEKNPVDDHYLIGSGQAVDEKTIKFRSFLSTHRHSALMKEKYLGWERIAEISLAVTSILSSNATVGLEFESLDEKVEIEDGIWLTTTVTKESHEHGRIQVILAERSVALVRYKNSQLPEKTSPMLLPEMTSKAVRDSPLASVQVSEDCKFVKLDTSNLTSTTMALFKLTNWLASLNRPETLRPKVIIGKALTSRSYWLLNDLKVDAHEISVFDESLNMIACVIFEVNASLRGLNEDLPSLKQLKLPQPIDPPASEQPIICVTLSEVSQKVMKAVKDIVPVGIEVNDDAKGFMDIGLDSLTTVDLVNRINGKYFPGLQLTTTDLFNHPNIASLSRSIWEKVVNEMPKQSSLHKQEPLQERLPLEPRLDSPSCSIDHCFAYSECQKTSQVKPHLQTVWQDEGFLIKAETATFSISDPDVREHFSKLYLPSEARLQIKIMAGSRDFRKLYENLLRLMQRLLLTKSTFVVECDSRNSLARHSVDAFLKTVCAEKWPRFRFQWNEQLARIRGEFLLPTTNGTWLITGGTRGIGLEMAVFLASRGASELVLLGRRPPEEQSKDRFKNFSCKVLFEQIDVEDEDALRKIFSSLKTPLEGIVHSAGATSDALLERQSLEKFNKTFNAKCNGAKLLDKVCKEFSQPNHFIVNSSMASVFGNKGQANYAFANGWLDGFIEKRRARELSGTSICWGNWNEAGMAASMQSFFSNLGFIGLTTADALRCFAYALAKKPVKLIAANMNWEKVCQNRRDLPRTLISKNDDRESSNAVQGQKSATEMAIAFEKDAETLPKEEEESSSKECQPQGSILEEVDRKAFRTFHIVKLHVNSVEEQDTVSEKLKEHLVRSSLSLDETISSWNSLQYSTKKLHSTLLGRTAMEMCDMADKSEYRPPVSEKPKVAFLIGGQGTQITNMGRQLCESFPQFRQVYLELLTKAGALFNEELDFKEIVYDPKHWKLLQETRVVQPLLLAYYVSLAKLYESFGVHAECYIGHSVGEIVAGVLAGILSVDDGLKLIVARGRALEETRGRGAMLAVDPSSVSSIPQDLEITAKNSSKQIVLAGPLSAILALRQKLKSEGRSAALMAPHYAFHSSSIKSDDLKEFEAAAKMTTFKFSQCQIFSNVDGARLQTFTPSYLVKQATSPVQFHECMKSLQKTDAKIWIDLSPQKILGRMAKREFATDDKPPIIIIPSAKSGNKIGELEGFMKTLLECEANGVEVDWQGKSVRSPITPPPAPDPPVSIHELEFAFGANDIRGILDHRIKEEAIVPAALQCAQIMQGQKGQLTSIKLLEKWTFKKGMNYFTVSNEAGKISVSSNGQCKTTCQISPRRNVINPLPYSKPTFSMKPKTYYQRLESNGIAYGRNLRVLRRIFIDETTVYAELRNSLPTWGALEGGLQSLAAVVLKRRPDVYMVPIAIESITLHQNINEVLKNIVAIGQVYSENDLFVHGHVDLHEGKSIVASIRGVTAAVQQVPRSSGTRKESSSLKPDKGSKDNEGRASTSTNNASPATEVKSRNGQHISILGYSGQFSGEAINASELWQQLKTGVTSQTRMNHRQPAKHCQLMDRPIEEFDPEFFGISPKEATFMDPQQRLLLESVWRTMENSGVTELPASTGVYVAVSTNDFALKANAELTKAERSAFLASGTHSSVLAGRIAHWLKVNGPAVVIDTACSSSLVALAAACDALISNKIDFAIVAAVNVLLNEKSTEVLKKAGMLSAESVEKVFDAAADGYVRGEGVASLLLTSKLDLKSSNPRILAWSVAHNGESSALSVPNGTSQESLIRRVLAQAGCTPKNVECHGTGTALGDPIETAAIAKALGKQRIVVSSVKNQLGHCEAAAGLASMLSVLQQHEHGYRLPAQHFKCPNPKVNKAIEVPLVGVEDSEAVTLIDSFGFSGTNACIVLETLSQRHERSTAARPLCILPLSAKTVGALKKLKEEFDEFVAQTSLGLNQQSSSLYRRKHFRHREVRVFNYKHQEVRRISSVSNKSELEGILVEPLRFTMAEMRRLTSVAIAKDTILNAQSNSVFYFQLLIELLLRVGITSMKLCVKVENEALAKKVINSIDASQQEIKSNFTISLIQRSDTRSPKFVRVRNGRVIRHHLDVLAEIWSHGANVNWDTLATPYHNHCNKIPGYVFEPKRLWPFKKAERKETSDVEVEALHVYRKTLLPLPLKRCIQSRRFGVVHLNCRIDIPGASCTLNASQLTTKEINDGLKTSGYDRILLISKATACGTQILHEAVSATEILIAIWKYLENIPNSHLIICACEDRRSLWTALLRTLASERTSINYAYVLYETLKQVQDEAQGDNVNEVVVYKDGLRYVERLEEDRRSKLSQEACTGRLLITGGLGGIGRKIIERLRPRECVILTRRTKGENLPPCSKVIEFDCADGAAVRRVIEESGPFDVVVHCAGIVDNMLSDSMDRNRYLKVLKPKVLGLMNLLEAVQEMKPKRFIVISSVAAVLGSAGQTNYALANALMTDIAKASGIPVEVVHLGPIADVGMLKGDEKQQIRDQIERRGWQMLESDEAVSILTINEESEEKIVFKGNWEVIAEKQPHLQKFLTSLTHSEAAMLPNTPQNASLRSRIERCVEEVSELKNLEDNQDTGFMSLGLDSLSLEELRRRLQADLGVRLTSAELYDNSTLNSLQRLLEERYVKPELKQEESIPNSIKSESVAIVGYSGAFSGSKTAEEFWNNLLESRECITFDSGSHEDCEDNFVAAGGLLPDIDKFDHRFWNITHEEASTLDPQIRIFLQHSYNALESAGLVRARATLRTGIFAGAEPSEYHGGEEEDRGSLMRMFHMNQKDFVAAWTAHKLDLRGPAISTYTACSSALVAIRQAMNALVRGEVDIALAGAVSLQLPEDLGYIAKSGMILSQDGHCRPFDAETSGTVRGSGVGVFVLTRADYAFDSNLPIRAIIRGCGVSNDGVSKASFMAPNTAGQAECMRLALQEAGPDAIENVGFIETHGTATKVGDEIELAALKQVYGKRQIQLGAVKASIGHSYAAAGAAGLIKALKILETQRIPPQIHFHQFSDDIDVDFELSSTEQKLDERKQLVAVSAFGIGGTNAHVILEASVSKHQKEKDISRFHMLPISAKSEASCLAMCKKLAQYLARDDVDLAKVAATLQHWREIFRYRVCVYAETCEEAILKLTKITKVYKSEPLSSKNLAFFFAPQGVQYPNMERHSLELLPEFKSDIASSCSTTVTEMSILCPDSTTGTDEIYLAEHAQVALFVVCNAIRKQLQRFGIHFSSLIGHSVGEYCAAVTGGSLKEEDAIKLLQRRGQIIGRTQPARMLAVRAPRARLPLTKNVEISAVLSENFFGVVGPPDAMEEFERRLHSEGIEYKELATKHGFHSSMISEAVEEFAKDLKSVAFDRLQQPLISTMDGVVRSKLDADYFLNQMQSPVDLKRSLDSLLLNQETKVIVEIGPAGILQNLLQERQANVRVVHTVLSKRNAENAQRDESQILNAVAELWALGYELDFKLFNRSESFDYNVPTYQFDSIVCWKEKRQNPKTEEQAFWQPCWVPFTGKRELQENMKVLLLCLENGDNVFRYMDELVSLRALPHSILLSPEEAIEEACFDEMANALRTKDFIPDIICLTSSDLDGAILFDILSRLHEILLRQFDVPFVLLTEMKTPATSMVIGVFHGRLLSSDQPSVLVHKHGGTMKQMIGIATAEPRARSRCISLTDRPLTIAFAQVEAPATKDIARVGQIILILGGAGGIGCELLRRLAKLLKTVAFILASRKPNLSVEMTDEIDKQGHSLLLLPVDLADTQEVRDLMNNIKQKFGRIDTIIHSAGIATAMRLKKSHADIEIVFAPKVKGTANILNALGEHDLHLENFFFMSSLSAIVPVFGAEDYASANAFIDEVATQGHPRVKRMLSIQWPAWKDVGMMKSSTETTNDLFSEGALSPTEGTRLFVQLLRSDLSGCVAVSKANPVKLQEVLVARQRNQPLLKKEIPNGQSVMEKREAVRKIWSESLSTTIEDTDNFFALGGNSLSALRITWRLSKELGISVQVNDIFKRPQFLDFYNAHITAGRSGAQSQAMNIVDKLKSLKLTYSQENMFLLRQIEPPSVYNIVFAISLKGNVDEKALRFALLRLTARQTSLRSSFLESKEGPIQEVWSLTEAYHEVFPKFKTRKQYDELIQAEKVFAHDLSGIPYRILVVKVKNQVIVVISQHHIITDGWSMTLFAKEFSSLYEHYSTGGPELEKPACSIVDYAEWQKRQISEEMIKSMISKSVDALQGYLATRLVQNNSLLSESRDMRIYEKYLPAVFVKKVTELTQSLQTTSYAVMLAAFMSNLRRWKEGEEDGVVVGCALSGRNNPEVDPLIGFFLNNYVIYMDIAASQRLEDVIGRLTKRLEELREFEQLPFHRLATELYAKGHKPVFSCFFNYRHNLDFPRVELPGIEASVEQLSRNSPFELSFTVDEIGEKLRLQVEYDASRVELSTITGFLHDYCKSITLNASRIPTNPTVMKCDYVRQSLGHQLHLQTQMSPGNIAVQCESGCSHYDDILQQALATTKVLEQEALKRRAESISPDDMIPFCANAENVALAILSVISTGAAFAPMDSKWPQAWKDKLALQAPVAIDDAFLNSVKSSKKRRKLFMRCTPFDCVYVLHTSGSTGEPKGVAVSHENLSAFLASAQKQTLMRTSLSVLHSVNLVFDVSMMNIFGSLLNGSKLIVPPSLLQLNETIFAKEVKFAFLTSAMFNSYTSKELTTLRSLERLFIGGESIHEEPLLQILRSGHDVTQIYGPTETTIWCLTNRCKVERNVGKIIGKPMVNLRMNIARDGREGEVGELVIHGAQVARGYLDGRQGGFKTEKDDQSYHTGDFVLQQGNRVQYFGRLDDEVKVRGVRVDLKGIETLILCSFPQLTNVVAKVFENSLIIFATKEIGENELKDSLDVSLPAALQPRIVLVDRIPMTANGKIDGKELRKLHDAETSPTNDEQSMKTLRSFYEESLSEIWANVLGRTNHRFASTDDFFEVGGHSLHTYQLRDAINTRLKVSMSIGEIFTLRRLKDMADRIARKLLQAMGTTEDVIVSLRESSAAKINVYLIHAIGGTIFQYYSFLQVFPETINVYAVDYRDGYPETSLKQLAAFYALKVSKIKKMDNLQIAQHTGNKKPFVMGQSLGGMLAREMTPDLKAFGFEEMFRPLPEAEHLVARAMKLAHMTVRHEFTLSDIPIILFKAETLGVTVLQKAARVDMDEDLSRSQLFNGWERHTTGPLTVHLVRGDHESVLKAENLRTFKDLLLAPFQSFLS